MDAIARLGRLEFGGKGYYRGLGVPYSNFPLYLPVSVRTDHVHNLFP